MDATQSSATWRWEEDLTGGVCTARLRVKMKTVLEVWGFGVCPCTRQYNYFRGGERFCSGVLGNAFWKSASSDPEDLAWVKLMPAFVNGEGFLIRHWKLNVGSFCKGKTKTYLVLTVGVDGSAAGCAWAGTERGICACSSAVYLWMELIHNTEVGFKFCVGCADGSVYSSLFSLGCWGFCSSLLLSLPS